MSFAFGWKPYCWPKKNESTKSPACSAAACQRKAAPTPPNSSRPRPPATDLVRARLRAIASCKIVRKIYPNNSPASGLLHLFGADVDDQAVVFDVVTVGIGNFFLGGFDFCADEFDDRAGFHADHVVVVLA